MELIQKYSKEDRAIGIDNLHRRPSNSDALGFLSATTSAASTAELLTGGLFGDVRRMPAHNVFSNEATSRGNSAMDGLRRAKTMVRFRVLLKGGRERDVIGYSAAGVL